MKINNFEDFEVWKIAISLSTLIYKITSKNNFEKDFWLRDQIRRSTVSIASNIAEWFERSNNTEFIRYLKISKWSCWEARTQLEIANNIWYLWDQEFINLKEQFLNLSWKLWSLIKYLDNHKKQWTFKNK